MNPSRLQGAPLAAALLHPRSIAIVGASDDASKTSGRPLAYLLRAGYRGRLFPINPKRETVQGVPAWPSLEALPEVPDHVFVLTPTDSVVPAVESCAALGVKVVTILASGFSEAGEEGRAREARLLEIAARSGLRILGPSSIGVVHGAAGVVLTANAAFAEPDLPRGRVMVASHSGSMIGALVSRGKARGIGFAGLVSVGSEVDLTLGEICESTLDDEGIDGYLLFLESLHHGADIRRFALEAARRGKPVVAYKLGRSDAAAEMSATHTGALAGEDDIADAFLKDCGIARVGVLDALLETMPLARRVPLGQAGARRVGVITTTGGGAAMAVDQLGVRDITVQAASPETLARLAAKGISVAPGRVVDLTLAGVNYDVMKAALEVMLDAPEFDMVLATIGSSARFQPELAVKPIVDSAGHARPLAAMMVPDAPEALAMLTAAGVPCFRNPEPCADAIAAVYGRRVPRIGAEQRAACAPGASLSEAQAYEVLDALGVSRAPTQLLALDSTQCEAPPFGFPVVAKVCSEHIAHKTEVGGVVLHIASTEQLTDAVATLRANLAAKAPGVPCDQVLVQPMARGLGEVLVGYRIDPDAGAIVMLAAGGIWAEVARDRSIRLAPVSEETAMEMIGEVKALKTLTGLRGKARGDLAALAKAVSALSQLATRDELRIVEAEINPLMVLAEGQGVLAVDALMLRVRDQWNSTLLPSRKS